MALLGAEVVPVEAGARTLKEAVSAAIRDWVANVGTTHYVIGSAVGPAPFPALVRDLQRVIGDESREQALEAQGALPARVIACVHIQRERAVDVFIIPADEQHEAQVWCGECDAVLESERGWTEKADAVAQWSFICTKCCEAVQTKASSVTIIEGEEAPEDA